MIRETELAETLRDLFAAAVPRDGKLERKVKRLCIQVLGDAECREIADRIRTARQRHH